VMESPGCLRSPAKSWSVVKVWAALEGSRGLTETRTATFSGYRPWRTSSTRTPKVEKVTKVFRVIVRKGVAANQRSPGSAIAKEGNFSRAEASIIYF
jgi:hypothetical protein